MEYGDPEVRRKYEWACRQNEVVGRYLDNCRFIDGCYVPNSAKDPYLHYQAERLTGGWWAFLEQEKNINFLKAKLENEKIAVDHYKDRVEFMEKRLERQAQTIALLQGRKTRAEAAKDFDDTYE